MCLLALAWRVAPGYPLLVAANRDERHDRPTHAAAGWTDRPILGGRDGVAHGGWLAVDRRGRLAAVTNFRDPAAAPAPRSRGALVADFLTGARSAADFAAAVAASGAEYGPFNLLLLDGAELRYASNRAPGARLTPGVHVLSNAALGTDWPKTRTARAGLERLLLEAAPVDALFELLGRRAVGADRYLSAHFVDGPVYGTKSSTVITVDAGGTLTFIERSFDSAARLTGEVRETFALAAAPAGSAGDPS
jgi:uncharacterized protein with NRDE domain